jgi:hypothetical protein
MWGVKTHGNRFGYSWGSWGWSVGADRLNDLAQRRPETGSRRFTRYRRELEHSLKAFPAEVPVRAQLQDKLNEVKAEQQSRERIRSAGGIWPVRN